MAVFVPVDTVHVHDTTYTTLIDTIVHTVYDTIIETRFDTIENYIYVHDTNTITEHDTIYLPVYIHDTVNSITVDTIYLPQYIHDTIIIHDTIVVGVDEVEAINAKVYFNRGQIVVEGADGNMVTLYDVTGRILATKQDYGTPLRFDIPASGTYMIKIGNYPARKVVVVR